MWSTRVVSTIVSASGKNASSDRRVTARPVVDGLLQRGLLSKDTHGTVVRIAPPLVIAREDLAWAVGEIAATLRDLEGRVTSAA